MKLRKNANIIAEKMTGLAGRAIDAVLPPRCVITGEIVAAQGMISPMGFAGLDFIAEPFCAACGAPFDFEADAGTLCVGCAGDRPPFETARAALKYNDASRGIILGFKHGDKIHSAPAFVPWLKRAGAAMLAEADYMAPVPLHIRRLIARRYNQAAVIAYALERNTAIEVLPDLLIRRRHTPSQGHLGAKARFRNVKKAFTINEKYAAQIAGKTIALVDDVYTTGATVRECAGVLLKAGAGKVHVLTLAKSARSEFN